MDGVTFEPEINWLGFKIKSARFTKDQECSGIGEFSTQLALLISNLNGKEKSNYLLKCFNKANKNFRAMYNLLGYKNIGRKSLDIYLNENGVDPKLKEKILFIYDSKKQQKDSVTYFDLIKRTLRINVNQDYPHIYLEIEKIKKDTPQFYNSFWSDFLNLIFAIKVKNESWVKNEIDNLLRTDLESVIYGYNRFWSKDPMKGNEIYSILDEAFKLVKSEIKDEEVKYIFNSKFSYIEDSNMKIFERHSWTLDEIRGMIKNNKKMARYMGYWKDVLEGRVSRVEFFQYMHKTMNPVYLSKFDSRDFWLLMTYFPNDQKRRDLIRNALTSYDVSNDFFIKWVKLELAEISAINKWLREKNPEFEKPGFVIKRKFYKLLLESGQATEFALYNLLQLGDKNLDYLWWLVL